MNSEGQEAASITHQGYQRVALLPTGPSKDWSPGSSNNEVLCHWAEGRINSGGAAYDVSMEEL